MMTFRYPSEEKINRFWKWFDENASELYQLVLQDLSLAQKKIDNRLKSLNRLIVPELWFDDSGTLNLVFSADGIEQVFPAVEAIVEKAPSIKGWNFIAFRQPQNISKTVEIDGQVYNLDDFCYTLAERPDGKVDLTIYVKNYDAQNYYTYLSAVFRIINLLLGEYLTVKFIENVQVKPYEEVDSLAPLRSLPTYFQNR